MDDSLDTAGPWFCPFRALFSSDFSFSSVCCNFILRRNPIIHSRGCGSSDFVASICQAPNSDLRQSGDSFGLEAMEE